MGNKFAQQSPVTIQDAYRYTFSNVQSGVSVLNWNILATCYTDPIKYHYVKPEYLTFAYRSNLIMKTVKDLNADLITFQEVDQFEEFYKNAFLSQTSYDVIYVQRPVKPNGLMIGWKRDKYQLLDKQILDFDTVAEKGGYDISYIKNNIAILSIMRDVSTDIQFGLVTTHLTWSPKDEHIKYHQMLNLVSRINDYYKEADFPIIFTGDFNHLPHANGINYVLTKQPPEQSRIEIFQPKLFEAIKQDYEKHKDLNQLNWKSAYEDYRKGEKHPQFTNYVSDWLGCIDYIFYTKELMLRRILNIPTLQEVSKEVALPNVHFPSDHLPVMAEFDFFPKK